MCSAYTVRGLETLRNTMNIILLGDSTIDNASYTNGGRSVLDYLHSLLGSKGAVTMLAVDESMTTGVRDRIDE